MKSCLIPSMSDRLLSYSHHLLISPHFAKYTPVHQSCSSTVGPPAGQVRYVWGEVDGTTFYSKITAAYEVVIHWRPNLFIPPLGTFGNKFVGELAKLFSSFCRWDQSRVYCNESNNCPTTASFAETKQVK